MKGKNTEKEKGGFLPSQNGTDCIKGRMGWKDEFKLDAPPEERVSQDLRPN